MAGLSEESRFVTRYFIARADKDGKIFQLDTGHVAALTSSGAQRLALEVLESGRITGYTGVYKFLVSDRFYGRLVVFLDCRERLGAVGRVLGVSLAIGAGGLVVVFALISIFSRRAIAPVAESIEKQRRFITDASHELKTPLAIISANAEVLGYDCGENEWLTSIQNQTKRLGALIGDMLMLARLDEERDAVQSTVFSLDQALRETVEPYEAVAITRGLKLHTEINSRIGCRGDQQSIRRALSALLDNALKYAGGEGRVEISLTRRGRWSVVTVFNTVKYDADDSLPEYLDKLFDRFYRADSSRSRNTGGYGLGLSITRSIAEANKGTITAKLHDEGIVFTVTLPYADVR